MNTDIPQQKRELRGLHPSADPKWRVIQICAALSTANATLDTDTNMPGMRISNLTALQSRSLGLDVSPCGPQLSESRNSRDLLQYICVQADPDIGEICNIDGIREDLRGSRADATPSLQKRHFFLFTSFLLSPLASITLPSSILALSSPSSSHTPAFR